MRQNLILLFSAGVGLILAYNALKEGSWAPLGKKVKESVGNIGTPTNPLKLRSGVAPQKVRQWKPI